MSVLLVAGCNEAYLGRFQGCVASLQAHANVPYHLFSVGFDAYNPLSREQNAGAPPESECIQHGSFLQLLPDTYGPDTVIIYLDGDVLLQRPFNAGELAWLESFPASAVSATWNQIGENLADCTRLLGPAFDLFHLREAWGPEIDSAPSLNAGVVAARRSTWERAYELYMRNWDAALACFAHPARQQWLMCWCYASLRLATQIMPWSFHAHGHFGLKPGMERRRDGIFVDGQLAAFRHYV